MEIEKLEKLSKIILKAKICGLYKAAGKSRKMISKSSGKERDRHWQMKRAIGSEVRWHILAQAFIHEKPYKSIEKKTCWQNRVNVRRLAEIIAEHQNMALSTRVYDVFTVEEWLKGVDLWPKPIVQVEEKQLPKKLTLVEKAKQFLMELVQS